LAFYHFRANSASQDNRRLLTDARVVVDRGHGTDPRLRIAAQAHAEGRDPAYRNLALYYIVTYLATQEIGAGRDGLDLLDVGDFPPVPNLCLRRSPALSENLYRHLLTSQSRIGPSSGAG
jgi:hypothetical protein